MNKILKYGLLGIGVVVALAAAGIAYVAAAFNPNDYKAQIIKAVKDSKQRNLRLDGDIKLSFFPSIGASLSKVSLSEFKSDKEFAAIDSARVSLAIMPLLRKQVVVDEVAVSGLQASLVMHKDGTSNFDDLLGPAGQKQEQQQEQQQQKTAEPPVKFDIASVSLEKANLSYSDEGSGAQYAIKDLNFKSGRIASGVPDKIEFSAGIQASQPKLDINTQLKATLTFDLDKQKYQLQGLELLASGTALDIGSLKVTASGDVSAEMATQEFAAKKFVLNASGIKARENEVSASANVSEAKVKQSGQSYKFEARLDAPSLSLARDKYSGDKVTLNAKLDGTFGNVAASLSLPGVEGNAQSFRVSALSLDLDLKQPDQTFNVKLSSPLAGNIKTRQFDLGNLSVTVNATGDKLPNKSVSSEMKGSVHVDALKQGVQANLAGGLLQSQIKAKLGVQGFAEPAIKFDADIDQFDADLYLPKSSPAAPKSPANAVSISKEPEQPLDLSALRKLNLDGSLRIGALKIMNVKFTQLRVDVKALNGLVNINPISARLYQGSTNGSLSLNAQTTPSLAIIQNLNGVNVAPLAKDAANLDMLEGNGNIGVNLTARGNTVGAMKKALNGHFSLNLADGAVKGIDIDKKLLAAQAMLSGGGGVTSESLAANSGEKSTFKEFKATFKVTNGVAHNDDLSLRTGLVRVSGQGDINIGNDSVDYFAKAAITRTADGKSGLTVPVHVSGPYADLKYTLDYGAMLRDAVKQKVDEKIESRKQELKNQLQDQLKDKLKGLFN